MLPLIRRDHWTFRAFEFPRLQKFIFGLAVFVFGWFMPDYSVEHLVGQALVLAFLVYSASQILPFTPLAPKTLPGTKKGQPSLKLLIANVYQPNRQYERLRECLKKHQPDMILLVETDRRWQAGIKEFVEQYPHKCEKPQDNTYGMLLYSRYPLKDMKIDYLVNEAYPSMHGLVELDGADIRFFGIHPPPPAPGERTYSTPRDAELMVLAKRIGADPKDPALVAGDLNDVAWSYTTREFLRETNLKDPRRGRGIFATFNAKNILLRWPLDHIFCSEHFRLNQMKRLPAFGSDHFPVLVELSLSRSSRQR